MFFVNHLNYIYKNSIIKSDYNNTNKKCIKKSKEN